MLVAAARRGAARNRGPKRGAQRGPERRGGQGGERPRAPGRNRQHPLLRQSLHGLSQNSRSERPPDRRRKRERGLLPQARSLERSARPQGRLAPAGGLPP